MKIDDKIVRYHYDKTMVKQRSNSAKKKLDNQPFRTVAEKKEFVDKIKKDVLARLETAKAMEEFTNQPEYAFYKEKFEKGMSCKYGADIDDIVHVSLTDDGIQIKISDSAKDTENKNELELIGHLVRAMSQSSLTSYYEAMGYLPREKAQPNFDSSK